MNAASERIVIVGNIERTIVDGMTRKMYGRTKYGGVNIGLVQENKTTEWACQACGDLQASELPAYMFEFLPNEFIRICSICQAKKLTEQIRTLDDLLTLTRKTMEIWDS